MVSIILSSFNEKYYQQFEENVNKTIGVPYEIVRIENHGLMGICKAYNLGIEKSKYNILCFCHEDILFKTQNWGHIVLNIFSKNTSLGLLGIAGSNYKTAIPSGWGFVPQFRSVNIIQHYKFRNWPVYNHYENPQGKSLVDAVCIDGVWMCTTKNVLANLRFDERTFKSFHCYDLDLSLSILKKYRVAVTFDVLIEHFSEGRNDSSWINDSIALHKKWRKVLPLTLDNVPKDEQMQQETSAAIQFQRQMNDAGLSVKKQLAFLISSTFIKGVRASEILHEVFRISLFNLKKKVKHLRWS